MKHEKIHEDKRGVISLLTGLQVFPEVTIFETKKGCARGGCIHEINDEFCCVIEGKVLYYVNDIEHALSPGDCIVVPKSTPHYFIAVEDSVVMEWGPTPEEKRLKYKLFRDIVEKINS